MGRYFGTDGIRGRANFDLTPELAMKTGRAAAYVISRKKGTKATILIGRDTRISGDMLEGALCAGITSAGCDVLLSGILPTPAVAYLTASMDIDCGIMITASHNHFSDNVIKLFSSDGYKLSDDEEAEMERYISSGLPNDFTSPDAEKLGRVMILPDGDRRYEFFVESRARTHFGGLSLALDCANGAVFKAAPDIFSGLGARVVAINSHPTGTNINQQCGSTDPDLLCKMVSSGVFDAGFAFDGDGDRLTAVDEMGETLDGDQLLAIFARYYAQQGTLAGNTLTATIMSNLGLEISMKEAGIGFVRTGVGDRKVMEKMKQERFNIGGEQSGHIIFLDDNTTGDGIISALHLLMIMKETGKKLSELKKCMKRYPQVLKNVRVNAKDLLMADEDLSRYLEEENSINEGKFRIVVRASGTESVIRVMAEGSCEEETEKLVKKICNKIKETDNRMPAGK